MEWKELEIGNLLPDILTGDYEFMLDNEEIGFVHRRDRANIFDNLIRNDGKYRYRKPESKQPTHEEIMTKWWRYSGLDETGWIHVYNYSDGKYMIPILSITKGIERDETLYRSYPTKEWFIGREPADIPPEA